MRSRRAASGSGGGPLRICIVTIGESGAWPAKSLAVARLKPSRRGNIAASDTGTGGNVNGGSVLVNGTVVGRSGTPFTTTFKAKAFHAGLTDSATVTAGFTNSADSNPSNVSGLKLWLRADAGVPTGWGDYWADQSGQGNHAVQSVGVALPRLVSNVVNGLPVLRFDGANDWVAFTNRLTTIRTVFWVIKKDAAAPGQCRFMLGDSSNWDFHSDCDHTLWSPYYASGAVTGGHFKEIIGGSADCYSSV